LKTSAASPVDRRVLIRLSPSVPWGRVSNLTVMSGLAFSKASMSGFAVAAVAGALSAW
jgi:hypothetical protein